MSQVLPHPPHFFLYFFFLACGGSVGDVKDTPGEVLPDIASNSPAVEVPRLSSDILKRESFKINVGDQCF